MSDPRMASSLFDPLRLGGLEIKNRIVLGPMAVLAPREDGKPSEQTIAFLTRRARGGVGLVIIGGGAATERMYEEAPYQPLLRLDRDDYIPDLRRVTDAVHAAGAPIFAEVMGGFGPMGRPSRFGAPIAASSRPLTMSAEHMPDGILIPGDRVIPAPQEATRQDIRASVDGTVAAAVRMQRAGFDGVEIGAHMSYLHASFLSPRTNWRTDEYGGSAENRARILVEIVRGIHLATGVDFPVGLRMSVNDHCDGGQGPDGFAEIAAIVAREGLAYVALTDANYEAMDVNAPSVDGAMIEHGEPQVFRAALPDTPLLLSSINDPVRAARAIDDGHGDAVMLARQLLADPDYVVKVQEGRWGDVVRCTHDNTCLKRLLLNFPVRCSVNREMGREARAGLPPARRVLRRPVEDAVLLASNSKTLVGIGAKLAARKAGTGSDQPVA